MWYKKSSRSKMCKTTILIVTVLVIVGITTYYYVTKKEELFCTCSGMQTMTNKPPFTFWQQLPQQQPVDPGPVWISNSNDHLVPISQVGGTLPPGAVNYTMQGPVRFFDQGVGVM